MSIKKFKMSSEYKTKCVSASDRKPEFIVIGSMKSGSTTLWKHLDLHPKIFMCRPKEPQFFSRDHVYENGWEWYCSLFADAEIGQICGEASVCYTRHPLFPNAADRIALHLPLVKLIFVVRDPVHRALSHYRHNMQEREADRLPHLTFSEAAELDPSILSAGCYYAQLQHYLRHYSRRSLLVVRFEQLVREPRSVLDDVANFLNVPIGPWLNNQPIRANRFGQTLSRRRRYGLRKKLKQSPVYWFARLLPSKLRSSLGDLLMHPVTGRLLTLQETRRLNRSIKYEMDAAVPYLSSYYSRHNDEFRSFLGVETLDWSDDKPPAMPEESS